MASASAFLRLTCDRGHPLCTTNATRHLDYCKRCKTFIVLRVRNGVRELRVVDRREYERLQSLAEAPSTSRAPGPISDNTESRPF